MRPRLLSLAAFLFPAVLILAACAPAEKLPPAPTERVSPTDEPTPYPEATPFPEETDADTVYPAPDRETDIYIPVTSGNDTSAYPAPPDEPITLPAIGDTSYPVPSMNALPANIKPENIVKFEDTAPKPEDKTLTPGEVFIDSIEAIVQADESNTANTLVAGQGLLIAGYLPTPCNRLRIAVSEPDREGNIEVTAYTVSDPGVMCIQVLEPFATFVPLADLPAGQYTISVNDGEQTAGMTIPSP